MTTLKNQIIDLYDQGYSYRQIANTLNCSKGTVSYHLSERRKAIVHKEQTVRQKFLDEIAQKLPLTRKEFRKKYIQVLTPSEYSTLLNKHYPSISRGLKKGEKIPASYYRQRRREIKEQMLEYLGGCCVKCGYNNSPNSLHFHHTDPETKSFSISSYRGAFTENVKTELDKCIILCANCHAETHDSFI